MIASLRGEITQVEDNAVVIVVGGVGMRVFIPAPLRDKFKPGEVVLLNTHLVVREDALTLYGFETAADRALFLLLLGVDGVGPKVALSVLSTLSLDAVQRAVFNDQDDVFNRVPGVGKKTAQKIVLHLKEGRPDRGCCRRGRAQAGDGRSQELTRKRHITSPRRRPGRANRRRSWNWNTY